MWPREIELDCTWTILLNIIKLKNGKHSRCVIGICDNENQYPELHKKYSNVDVDTIMNKLTKYGAVRAAWINAILKDLKQ